MISEDEYLERIVAGIHAVTTTDADVRWNESINGRQFDVVVRFRVGTLRYLVLVEVKNRTRKAEASDMDAFVSKARDQNANKAVFVTAAGYQEGAIAVAKRHGIDLFTVTFDENSPTLSEDSDFLAIGPAGSVLTKPPTIVFGEPRLVSLLEEATLTYADGRHFKLPVEASQKEYYCKWTRLDDGRTLAEIIEAQPLPQIRLGESHIKEIAIEPSQTIIPPDDYYYPQGQLTSIKCNFVGQNSRPMRGNVAIDRDAFILPVVYTNVLTGEKSQFSVDQLPLGDKRVSVGSFYFCIHPLMYFYCDSIRGQIVQWKLVESFQFGNFVRHTTTQDIKYSQRYIRVTDKKILDRLHRRLEDYIKIVTKDREAKASQKL